MISSLFFANLARIVRPYVPNDALALLVMEFAHPSFCLLHRRPLKPGCGLLACCSLCQQLRPLTFFPYEGCVICSRPPRHVLGFALRNSSSSTQKSGGGGRGATITARVVNKVTTSGTTDVVLEDGHARHRRHRRHRRYRCRRYFQRNGNQNNINSSMVDDKMASTTAAPATEETWPFHLPRHFITHEVMTFPGDEFDSLRRYDGKKMRGFEVAVCSDECANMLDHHSRWWDWIMPIPCESVSAGKYRNTIMCTCCINHLILPCSPRVACEEELSLNDEFVRWHTDALSRLRTWPRLNYELEFKAPQPSLDSTYSDADDTDNRDCGNAVVPATGGSYDTNAVIRKGKYGERETWVIGDASAHVDKRFITLLRRYDDFADSDGDTSFASDSDTGGNM